MANECFICCCGASTWTKVIAWFQICKILYGALSSFSTLFRVPLLLEVGCFIMVAFYAISLDSLTTVNPDEPNIPNKDSIISAVEIALVLGILGFFMGIILLKGSNEQRVGFLLAWLIYDSAAFLTSIVGLIISIIHYNDDSTGSMILSVIVGIAVNVFCFVIVFFHMKEIR